MNELEKYTERLNNSTLSDAKKIDLINDWKEQNNWNATPTVELDEVDLGVVPKKETDLVVEPTAGSNTDMASSSVEPLLELPSELLFKKNFPEINTAIEEADETSTVNIEEDKKPTKLKDIPWLNVLATISKARRAATTELSTPIDIVKGNDALNSESYNDYRDEVETQLENVDLLSPYTEDEDFKKIITEINIDALTYFNDKDEYKYFEFEENNTPDASDFIIKNYGNPVDLIKIGINPVDFGGFLVKNGLSDIFTEEEVSGVYGKETETVFYPGPDGQGYAQQENTTLSPELKLAKERALRNYLDRYMYHVQTRNNKFKAYKEVSNNIKKYEKDFKEKSVVISKYNSKDPENVDVIDFDYNQGAENILEVMGSDFEQDNYFPMEARFAYLSNKFPLSLRKDQEYLAKEIELQKEIDNRSDEKSGIINAGNVIVGLYNGATGEASSVIDFVVGDAFGVLELKNRRDVHLELERLRAVDQTIYSRITGLTATKDGVEFTLGRDDGEIYNVTAGYKVNNLSQKEKQKLTEYLEKNGKNHTSYSWRGYSSTAGEVLGGVAFQIALQYTGVGLLKGLKPVFGAVLNGTSVNTYKFIETIALRGESSLLLGKNLAIPYPAAYASAVMTQTIVGSANGYNTTIQMLAQDGTISKEDIEQIANDAAILYGALYAGTTFINPRTGLIDNMRMNAVKNKLNQAITTLLPQANKVGFAQKVKILTQKLIAGDKVLQKQIKSSVLKASNGVKDFVEFGIYETVQELTQQGGTIYQINEFLNKELGKEIFQTSMTQDEMVVLVQLSFMAGGLMSKARIPSFNKNNNDGDARIYSLLQLGQNKTMTQSALDVLVAQGTYTIDETVKLMEEVTAVVNNLNQVQPWFNGDGKIKAAILLEKIYKTEDEIKLQGTHGLLRATKEIELNKLLSDLVKLEKEQAILKINQDITNIKKIAPDSPEGTEYKIGEGRAVEVIDDKVSFSKLTGLPSYVDGYISEEGQIIINKERAIETQAVTVARHEFFHYLLRSTFSDVKAAKALVTDFKVLLKSKGYLDQVQKKIDANYRFKTFKDEKALNNYIKDNQEDIQEGDFLSINTNADGSITVEYSEEVYMEEYLTQFSDLVGKGIINLEGNKDFLNSLGDWITKAFKKEGFKNIKFDSAEQVYEFIKTYNSTLDKDVSELNNTWAGEAESLDEVVITSKKKRSVSDEVIEAALPFKAETNEELVKLLLNKEVTAGQKLIPAVAIVEKNWPVIQKIIGYTKGRANIRDVKEVIAEIIVGGPIAKWTGKQTSLFEEGDGFDIEKGEVTTFITRLKDRVDIIYTEAINRGGEIFEGPSLENLNVANEDSPSGFEQRTKGTLNPFKLLSNVDETDVVTTLEDRYPFDELKNVEFRNNKNYSLPAAEILSRKFDIPVDKIMEPLKNLSGDYSKVQLWAGAKGNIKTIINLITKGNTALTEEKSGNRTVLVGGKSLKLPRNYLKTFFDEVLNKEGVHAKVNNSLPYKLKEDMLDPFKAEEIVKKFFGLGEVRIQNNRSNIAQNIKAFLLVYSRILTADAISTIVEKQIAEGNITSGEGNVAIDKIGDGKSRRQRSITATTVNDIELAAKSKGGYPNILKKILTRNRKPTEKNPNLTVKEKVSDFESFIMQDVILNLKDYLNMFPNNYFHFRTGLTGTRVTHTFGKVGDFDNAVGLPNSKNNWLEKAISKINYTAFRKLLSGPLKKLEESSEERLNTLENLFLDYQTFLAVEGNENKTNFFSLWLKDGTKDQRHALRYLAPLGFYAIDPVTLKLSKLEVTEEHSMPAVIVGRILEMAAERGDVKNVFKVIRKSYMQGGLLLTADNKLLDLKLEAAMPEVFYKEVVPLIMDGKLDFLPDGYASLIRYSLNNVFNPFAYMAAGKDYTLGEYFVGKATALDGIKGVDLEISTELVKEKANELITDVITGKVSIADAKIEFELYQDLVTSQVEAFKINKVKFGKILDGANNITEQIEILQNYDEASLEILRLDSEAQGISILDFDDTVGITNSKIIVKLSTGNEIKITASEFAFQHVDLKSSGATFDFREFNKVIDGKKGPLFEKIKRLVAKYGNENVYILTARPMAAAPAIKAWLKSNDVDLKLENIVGLENGSPQAKANWVVSMAAKGYNDFYFADDVPANVEAVTGALANVLDQIDVKGVVAKRRQLSITKKDEEFNKIIEDASGVEWYKDYSEANARNLGKTAGGFEIIPPSAEDFEGLLYKFIGKGENGAKNLSWLKQNLIDPYRRATTAVTNAKVTAAQDFKTLKRKLNTLPKDLKKDTGYRNFTQSQAIRVYIWDLQGMNIPGLSKADLKALKSFMRKNPKLKLFANELSKIQKGKPYPQPDENWTSGTIDTDIINSINKVDRKKYLTEWQNNVDIIFSDKNKRKLRALYGDKYITSLNDILRRMKSGSNRPIGGSKVVNDVMDYFNASVGTVMFLNRRSGLLQLLSSVNFVNYGDNNILKAGKAVANQPQYWKDFMKLFNSPFLLDRRGGLKINVSESEIQDAVLGSKNKSKAFIAYLLSKGFVFTRYADSFAIATGGATFYRNRIDTYIEDGLSPKEAEIEAFEDFKALTELSQQSSDPMMISEQQASALGRLILAFGNTPMQYVRLQKKDIIALGRKIPIDGFTLAQSNRIRVSRIVYYGMIQNLIFNSLQNALFADLFDDEDITEEDDGKGRKERDEEKYARVVRILNGMLDSQLKGMGIGGAATTAVKDALVTILKESSKDKGTNYAKVVDDLLGFSPVIDSKLRKFRSAGRTFDFNMKEIKKQGWDVDNPALLATAQVTTGVTNVPIDKVLMDLNSLRNALDQRTEAWQKIALTLGWSAWDVGLPYYGVEDEIVETDETRLEDRRVKLNDLNKPEQVNVLLSLGLTKKEIKQLKYEKDRVKQIMFLQDSVSRVEEQKKQDLVLKELIKLEKPKK